MHYILILILWLGNSTFGLYVATGLHVDELTFWLSGWACSCCMCWLSSVFSSFWLWSLSDPSLCSGCFSLVEGGAPPSPWRGVMIRFCQCLLPGVCCAAAFCEGSYPCRIPAIAGLLRTLTSVRFFPHPSLLIPLFHITIPKKKIVIEYFLLN